MAERLDSRVTFPAGMEEYLSFYGWHFSKKMCQWAVSRMYRMIRGQKEPIVPMTKEYVDNMLRQRNIKVKDSAYDAVYLANMCRADFFGSCIRTEDDLALFVGDVLNDPDGYEGMPFTRFYADCIGSGTVILWEEML